MDMEGFMAAAANSESLRVLVAELSKVNPDVKVIKNKTDTLGIPFNADPIILMSEVLVYLSQLGKTKAILKEKPV